MDTFIYLVESRFPIDMNKGWGNGYVMIPPNHPSIAVANEGRDEDDSYWYFTLPIGFDQEITYTETHELNGEKWIRIGFDTGHIYNDKTNDFDWVFNETMKLKAVVDSYK